MKVIVIEITMLVLCIAFMVYLARDDRNNRRLREEEDRQKALQRADSHQD